METLARKGAQFERVQVNTDGIENDLPRHHCDDKNYRGIDGSTQRGATPSSQLRKGAWLERSFTL